VAWLVIKNCGYLDNHPFTFPMTMQVGASDSYGNYTTELSLLGVASADIVMTGGGTKLKPAPFVFNLQNLKWA
jgi:hypothetical protein